MGEVEAEMPRYKCHKEVHALKILQFTHTRDDGSASIVPAEDGYGEFQAPAGWMSRCKATESDLGYYVVYDDGYASWSPSKVFEEGYTKI